MALAVLRKSTGATVEEFHCSHIRHVVNLFSLQHPFAGAVEPGNLYRRLEQLDGRPDSYWAVGKFDGKIIGFGGLIWFKTPSTDLEGCIRDVVIDKIVGNRVQEAETLIVGHLLDKARREKLARVELALPSANPEAFFRIPYQDFGTFFEKASPK